MSCSGNEAMFLTHDQIQVVMLFIVTVTCHSAACPNNVTIIGVRLYQQHLGRAR